MSAICSQVKDPEDFVDKCYWVQTFSKVYEHAIFPVNGSHLWKKTLLEPPIPPNPGRRAGRPSRARRLEPDEPVRKLRKRKQMKNTTMKMRRQQWIIKCSHCKEPGHNKKYCKKKDQPPCAEPMVQEDQVPMVPNSETKPPSPVHEDQSIYECSQVPPMTQESQNSQKLTARKRTCTASQYKGKTKRIAMPTATNQGMQAPMAGPTSSVNIRAPVPFAANHPVVSPQSHFKTSLKGLVPTLQKDGKKYVSMSNLASLMHSAKKN